MELAFIVYGISLLTNISNVIHAFLVLGIFAGVLITCFHELIEREKLYKIAYRLGIAYLICIFLNILIPSQKTMYIMAGAYATQKVTENPVVQDLDIELINTIKTEIQALK